LLAALYANGEAPALGRLAADPKQDPCTRLTYRLALAAAGDDLDTRTVVDLLKEVKDPEARLVAVVALTFCWDRSSALARLVALLDDADERQRIAAIVVLAHLPSAPKEALPKVRKVLEDARPAEAVNWVCRIFGKAGTREAQEVLANFLEATLRDERKTDSLISALNAFGEATGKQWLEAGAHPPEYYREQARKALDWWKKPK
jgi:hypothetical protein